MTFCCVLYLPAGTHVAGIITALNSNADPAVESVVGISPGTPVFSLKILDAKGRGAMSNMLAAVQWVMAEGLAQGIRVINLSLAAYVNPGSPVSLNDGLQYVGNVLLQGVVVLCPYYSHLSTPQLERAAAPQ